MHAWSHLLIAALHLHRLLPSWVSEWMRGCPATIDVSNYGLVWRLLLLLQLWLLVHLLLIRRWLTALIIVVVALAVILLCRSSVLAVAAGRWIGGDRLQSGVCWVGDLNRGAIASRLIHVSNACNACSVHESTSPNCHTMENHLNLFGKSLTGFGKTLETQKAAMLKQNQAINLRSAA